MTSVGRNRPNRWPKSPVTWIGGVAILGLVIAGAFGIRLLVVNSGEGTTGSSDGTTLATQAEAERAGVEGDEFPVDSADGTAPDDRPDEEISDPPVPPEEAAESSSSGSPAAEEAGEPPAPVTATPEPTAAELAEKSDEVGDSPILTETEEVDGQPAPVTTTTEPSVAVAEESDEIEGQDELGATMSWRAGHGWIVPWGDGFLEVGWPKTGEAQHRKPIYGDESHLKARALSDSQYCRNVRSLAIVSRMPNCWEDLDHYLTPNGGESIGAAISDGDRMIVASETAEQVYISISSDLTNWSTTKIILSRPPSLPDFVYTFSYIDHLAMGPNGWLLKTTTEFTIDVLGLTGIRELETKISAYDLKGEVNKLIGSSNVDFEEGIKIDFQLDNEESEYMTRVLSWDELGFSQSEFRRYYADQTMKPYIFSDNILGSAWIAMWGEEPVRVGLPDISEIPDLNGTCCSIVGTKAGYIAISDPSEPGYNPTLWGPGQVFFSPDGYEWTPVDSPPAVFFDTWAVSDGVIVSGVLLEARAEDWNPDDWDEPFFWWFVDPNGSNWREIEEPSQIPPRLTLPHYPTIRMQTVE